MSLFKRKQSLGPPPDSANASSSRTSRAASTPAVLVQSVNNHSNHSHIDDFGRKINPGPAFVLNGSGGTGKDAFGHAYGVGDDEEPSELQLIYGYAVLGTTVELSLLDVDYLVTRCTNELRLRGLDTPLVLSSTALDQSMEGTSSLIRQYLHDIEDWASSLHLAAPLDVGGFMKWGLARMVNDKGGRGFLSWDSYTEFKIAEKANGFPAGHTVDALIARLPRAIAHLLSTLLELFSSLAGYSAKNGMTPRRLASLFGAYAFGIADDQPFDETYAEWQRTTDAFEHVLLSYIRGQQATSGRIPTHLEKFIQGYPQCLNVSYAASAKPKVPRGGRVEEITRVRKLTRFHSRNLIQSAGTWDVPHSPDWLTFFPRRGAGRSASPDGSQQKPVFTPAYRHMLNIRSVSSDTDDGEGEIQRYKSVVDKEWGQFGERGFKEVDPSRLEFDLSESERNKPRLKHETMDWSTFTSSGFGGRETFSPADLIFRQNITQTVQSSPASLAALDQRLRETEKMLPPFPYDTTPHEEGRILVDANFFEAWADVLVASGWARDELKESNFALVQWKCRVREGELPRGKRISASDDRTEERWVLVEEYVPREYRDELKDGKKKKDKRVSFLRSVRRKKESPAPRINAASYDPPPSNASHHFHNFGLPPVQERPSRTVDDSVFTSDAGGPTRIMTLSSNVDVRTPSNYAPSVVSARHGHESTADFHDDDPPPMPSPLPPALSSPAPNLAPRAPPLTPPRSPPQNQLHGVSGTMSSQKRETAFQSSGGRGPVGYQKPPSGPKGFLARMQSKRNKNFAPASPYSFNAPPMPSNEPTGINGLHGAPIDSTSTVNAAEHANEPPRQYAPASLDPPPPPPKTPTSPSPPSPQPSHNAEQYDGRHLSPNPVGENRSSYSSVETTTDDAYDGIDDEDEAVQEGTVLFRGSRSFTPAPPAALPYPAQNSVSPARPSEELRRLEDAPHHNGTAFTPPRRGLPVVPDEHYSPPRVTIPSPSTDGQGVSHRRPDRHESLPPSPKPDAEVPIDEEVNQRDPRFMSGTGSRVANLVGQYQNRDQDVRLTQYGFNTSGSPPALGRVQKQ